MKRICWYRKLYMTEKARKKRYKIIWKINHKAGMLNTYVITVPVNGSNQLEIINSSELLQKHYDCVTTYVVGIAIGYDEAVGLVEGIVRDVLENTKTTDIRGFFRKDFPELK